MNELLINVISKFKEINENARASGNFKLYNIHIRNYCLDILRNIFIKYKISLQSLSDYISCIIHALFMSLGYNKVIVIAIHSVRHIIIVGEYYIQKYIFNIRNI